MISLYSLMTNKAMGMLAEKEILSCNEATARYGLALSATQAQELVVTRSQALESNGRIEFGGGIIQKLIMEFCDSPFLSQYNYASTLNDLVETFYYFKNETLDEIEDDELLQLMKEYFDHHCQGCIELLQNRELEALARHVRFGGLEDQDMEEDEEEEDWDE